MSILLSVFFSKSRSAMSTSRYTPLSHKSPVRVDFLITDWSFITVVGYFLVLALSFIGSYCIDPLVSNLDTNQGKLATYHRHEQILKILNTPTIRRAVYNFMCAIFCIV